MQLAIIFIIIFIFQMHKKNVMKKKKKRNDSHQIDRVVIRGVGIEAKKAHTRSCGK